MSAGKKILITSTNQYWGGSEYLWFNTMKVLLEKGFHVNLVIYQDLYSQIKVDILKFDNCKIIFIPVEKKGLLSRILRKVNFNGSSIFKRIELNEFDYVLISQGGTYEI